MVVKVAINGYGTIGKRVADAVDAQDDMEIVGVTKHDLPFDVISQVRKGYPLYCTYDSEDKIAAFGPAGYDCKGGLATFFQLLTLWSTAHQEKLELRTKTSMKKQA